MCYFFVLVKILHWRSKMKRHILYEVAECGFIVEYDSEAWCRWVLLDFFNLPSWNSSSLCNFHDSSLFDLLFTENSVIAFCRSVREEDALLVSKWTGEIHEQEKHQSDCKDGICGLHKLILIKKILLPLDSED